MNQAQRKRLSIRTLALLILALVTLAAYVNAWPDNLVLDDKVFATSERFSGLRLSDISHFFTEDLWASAGGNSGLYRPLLLVTLAMDSYVYGDWAAGYHLSNILLHLLVTLLVFGFIRHLLLVSGSQPPLADYMALLAAMIFGVHPIHTEVVNSIFNRSGLLVSVGVIGGLWWFLRTLESSPLKAWGGLALVYMLILLCRESGVILPALAVAMLWIFTPGNWRVHLRRSLPVLWLLIPLGIYLGLRANALDVPAMHATTLDVPGMPLGALDVPGIPDATGSPETMQITSSRNSSIYLSWQHLLPAATVWFDSLGLALWPHPLMIHHADSSTNEWMALVLQLVLVSLAMVGFRQKSYGLISGLAFFYIAILPASRIIGEAGVDPHVAERYIYLPSVGLTIALAFGLKWLTQQFNLRTAMAAVMIALVILTPITWARNAEWASDLTLYESEYRKGNPRGRTLRSLVGAYVREGEFLKATRICDRHADQREEKIPFSHRCGVAFGQVGRFDDAEKALRLALRDPKAAADVQQKLASMYLHLGRRIDAQKHFELSADTEHRPAFREFRKAYMLTKLYPSDRTRLLEAKAHLEQALQLQPQFVQARLMLKQLNKVLGTD